MRSVFFGRANSTYEGHAKAEDLLSQLQRLGFTDNESRAYIALFASYPATAYQVSKVSRLHKSNVYEVLKSLEAKGAVQAVNESPVRYVPRDPEDFFDDVANNARDLCNNLTAALKKKVNPELDHYIWTFLGKEKVHGKMLNLIAGAKNRIWLITSCECISPYLPALRKAARQGVEVIMVLSGEIEPSLQSDSTMKVIPHEGTGIKIGSATDILFTLTIDSAEMMVGTFSDESMGSYSRNRAIIYVIEAWILHEVYLSEMHQKLGAHIEASFGPGLSKLRNKYRPESRDRMTFPASL